MEGAAGRPLSGEARIAAILRRFEAGQQALQQPIACQPVTAGAVNSITRVTGHGIDWAVRVAEGSDDRLKVDRAGEFCAQEAAAQFRLAPAVVYADPAEGILVSHWIDAPASGAALFATTEGLARIGATLRRLHALPMPTGLRQVNALAVAEAYLTDPRAGSGPIPGAEYDRVLAACRSQTSNTLRAFCHNDLHGGNVLDNGSVWFLDWEYAGAGDPRFDLAGIVAYHDLDGAATAALLHGYGQYSMGDLDAWVVLFDLVRCLWMDVADAWGLLPEAGRGALLARLRR